MTNNNLSDCYTIAIDVMGGDYGPRITIPATLKALKRHPRLTVKLVGQADKIKPLLKKCSPEQIARIEIVDAPDVITMTDKPAQALRNGRDSSMHKSLQLVSEQKANACVSAGNTGALMVLGRFILRTLPGIDRPAIISPIPTAKGRSYLLDLGANVDCSAEHLLQFAIMGSVMVQCVEKLNAPRVALLNIGLEEIKGNEQVKLASRLIEEQGNLNYIGYVEGDGLYTGEADVVVCDGFVGNIALKTSEGLARFMSHKFRRSFQRDLYRKFVALLAKPVLTELKKLMDPSRRNGASLLGLQGIVIKSHGSADKACFGFAIDQAVAEIEQNLPNRISHEIAQRLT